MPHSCSKRIHINGEDRQLPALFTVTFKNWSILSYVENLVDYVKSVKNKADVFAKLFISIVFLSANGFLITKPKLWRLATTILKTTNMQETIQHQI